MTSPTSPTRPGPPPRRRSGPDPRGSAAPDAAAVRAIERRVRREEALGLLDRHPAIARDLGIGRPDLGGAFDDDGLIDLNVVPARVLASLPGITRQVQRIMTERLVRGGFSSIDELTAGGLLPTPLPRTLRDRLITAEQPGTSGRDRPYGPEFPPIAFFNSAHELG